MLSGCVAIDAVHLITIAADSRIHAIARSGVYPVEGQKVYYLEFDERRPMWAEKCNYDGIVVEYAKNWDTLGDHGQVTFRAKPNEPHGYAILIYQERCPNKPARDMLSTSEGTHIPYRGKLPFVNAGQGFNVGDYFSRALENRPKWMSQVVATVQAEAAWNPAAKSFLAHVPVADSMPREVRPSGGS